MIRFIWASAFSCLLGISSAANAGAASPDFQTFSETNKYISWQGIEPDKWSTFWLIKRYISPKAFFQLIPPNSVPPEGHSGILLDMPGAPINRSKDTSLFAQINDLLPEQHSELEYIEQIIYDVEVNVWERPKHPHSMWFESLFRSLQERYQKESVPSECYLLFFDRLAEIATKKDIGTDVYQNALTLRDECPGLTAQDNKSIPALGHQEILNRISTGQKVVFVDTREDEEFDEVHLPNSVVLRLREVNAESVKMFANVDLIVPYCVKDFRGFEVAKAIQQQGLQNVATLSPNGLKGWLSAKLPVVKPRGLTEAEAADALLECALEARQCLGRQL